MSFPTILVWSEYKQTRQEFELGLPSLFSLVPTATPLLYIIASKMTDPSPPKKIFLEKEREKERKISFSGRVKIFLSFQDISAHELNDTAELANARVENVSLVNCFDVDYIYIYIYIYKNCHHAKFGYSKSNVLHLHLKRKSQVIRMMLLICRETSKAKIIRSGTVVYLYLITLSQTSKFVCPEIISSNVIWSS